MHQTCVVSAGPGVIFFRFVSFLLEYLKKEQVSGQNMPSHDINKHHAQNIDQIIVPVERYWHVVSSQMLESKHQIYKDPCCSFLFFCLLAYI